MKKHIIVLAALLMPSIAQASTATLMGVYNTDNVASFTITGYCNQFGTCGTPTLSLNGSTSGTTVLQAPATGGGTLTFPSGSDTVAGLGQTQTFTGQNTFTSTVFVSGGVATQGTVFSTAATGNPLMQATVQTIPVASVNATGGYSFISGIASRKLYPTGLTVMANGTAAGATSVVVECTSGAVLGTFPIAGLVNNIPVTPFSSTGAISTGLAFASGCVAGDGVFISRVGSTLTTTTTLTINMPYTVQ